MRTATRIVAAVGAVASILLFFQEGAHPPLFLLILFIGWVLSPFVALFFLPWRGLAIAVTVVSLLAYATPHPVRTAAVYLMVPLASWIAIVIRITVSSLSGTRVAPPPG